MILFSGIILTADGVADIVFLIMIRLGNEKSENSVLKKNRKRMQRETMG